MSGIVVPNNPTMHQKTYYVYIMTNYNNTTLYTGMTSNLIKRVQQHKAGEGGSFTRRYKLKKLVYQESTNDVTAAIKREKQIKGGSRKSKIGLIESINPEWRDLSEDF